MIVIHYPTAFKALDEFISTYNLKANKPAEKIRAGAILTARELVRIYGISLLKASALPGFDSHSLPSLQTNNQQLASLVKCSARSIQRYVKKLISSGIITAKKFRGSNANYELWIKSEILSVGHRDGAENAKAQANAALSKAKQQGICNEQMPSCPHTYSGNFKNNLLIGVETVDNSENSGNIFRKHTENCLKNFVSGAEKGSAAAAPRGGDTRKIASQVDQSGAAHPAVQDPICDNFQTMYVRLFWMMARNLLYKNTDLTESQVDIAQKLIWNLYAPVKPEHIDSTHRIYIERLSLVSKYLAKDPERRFVPLPYIYFDTKNPKGFVGTRHWYNEHQKRKKEVMLELSLSAAIRRFTNNEGKEPVKRKPTLRVFRECENTLGKLGDPSIVSRFHAAVLEHQGFSKINTNTI